MPRDPKIELFDLKLNEFSTVDNGDNPEAHILLTKRAEEAMTDTKRAGSPKGLKPGQPGYTEDKSRKSIWARFSDVIAKFRGTEPREPRTVKEILAEADFHKAWEEVMKNARSTSEIIAEDELRSGFFKIHMALMESVQEILMFSVPEEMAAKLAVTVSEFGTEIGQLMSEIGKRDPQAESKLKSILDRMTQAVSNEGETPAVKLANFEDALADLEKDFAFPIETPPEEPVTDATKSIADILKDLSPEDTEALKTHFTPAPAAPAAAPAPAAKADGDGDGDEEDAALKALPASVRKILDDAVKTANEAKAETEKLRDEQARAEDISKARELGVDGVDIDKLADVMGAARKNGTEEAFTNVISSLAAQAKAGQDFLTSTKGSEAPQTDVHKSIEGIAEEIHKASAADPTKKTITKEAAYAEAIHANPELYDEQRNELHGIN